MVVIEMLLGFGFLAYSMGKTADEAKDDDEEDEGGNLKGKAKHQGWQTLDWQM